MIIEQKEKRAGERKLDKNLKFVAAQLLFSNGESSHLFGPQFV